MMVQQPWGISVYGAASVKGAPDVVRVRFKVVRVERTADGAFAAARFAVTGVRTALREHGIAGAAVDASRLDLKTATST
jgi:uncharacterized protein YggE